MAEEVFNKTPKKADRWFKAFIFFALIYGATFSLWGFFNWIFFLAAVYSLFMSYFLLPVQPKIFQSRPKQEGSRYRSTNQGQTQSQSFNQQSPEQKQKKTVVAIIAVIFGSFFIFLVIGIISSAGDDDTTSTSTEEAVDMTAHDESSDLVDKGDDFYDDKQYDSAFFYYDLAANTESTNMNAIYGKGIARFSQDRIDEANRYFEEAYNGGLKMAWLSWKLADTYERNGDVTKAVILYKESVNLDSTYSESLQRLADLEPANRDLYLRLAEKHKSN